MRRWLLAGSLLVVVMLSLGAATPAATGVSDGSQAGELDTQPVEETHGTAPINQVAHQILADESRGTVATQPVDAGAAITIGRESGSARLAEYALEERARRTDDDRAVLADGVDALAAAVDRTHRARASLRRSYRAGEIDGEAFLTGVARHQAALDRQERRLAWFQSALETRDAPELQAQVARLERELLGLDDPVRREALAALEGKRDSTRVYVAASENGTVLATVGVREHVRSVFRADLRRSDPAVFDLPAAASRAEELYPLAFGGDLGSNTAIRGRAGGAYVIESDLPFGSVESMMDPHSRTVFTETQRRTLAEIRQPATAAKRANGTHVVVNKTYPGGPLRISTRDNATGDAVNATVRVGDTRLQTGADGVAWTVAPPGKTMRMQVVRGDTGTVSMIVRTLELTPIDAS